MTACKVSQESSRGRVMVLSELVKILEGQDLKFRIINNPKSVGVSFVCLPDLELVVSESSRGKTRFLYGIVQPDFGGKIENLHSIEKIYTTISDFDETIIRLPKASRFEQNAWYHWYLHSLRTYSVFISPLTEIELKAFNQSLREQAGAFGAKYCREVAKVSLSTRKLKRSLRRGELLAETLTSLGFSVPRQEIESQSLQDKVGDLGMEKFIRDIKQTEMDQVATFVA